MFRFFWALFGVSLLVSGLSFAESPAQVRIRGVRAYGSGCPTGSAEAVIAPDGSAFSLLLNHYQAQSGGSTGLNNDRRQCDVELDIEVQPGWQFMILSSDNRGFVDIDRGAVAKQKVVYSFDGRRLDSSEAENDNESSSSTGMKYGFASTVFRGPLTQDYTLHNDVRVTRKPRSLCSRGDGHRLYLSTFLISRAPGGNNKGRSSLITLDSVDGAVQSQRFELAWFRCDQDPRGQTRRTSKSPGIVRTAQATK